MAVIILEETLTWRDIMDSLRVVADSVANTLANVVQSTSASQDAVYMDAFNCMFILATILSVCAIVSNAVQYFIKKKTAPLIGLPEVMRSKLIKELLWMFVSIISGSVILIVSWKTDYNTNNIIFVVTLALSLIMSLRLINKFIKFRRFEGSTSLFDLTEKIVAGFLWVFWLVLSGFYIASEFMDFSWTDFIVLWQNRKEYSSRLIEDLVAATIVTTKFVLILVKYKECFKRVS